MQIKTIKNPKTFSSEMEITILGTSEATPTAKRSQLAMLLTYKDENILVDCGEGTQRQFKIANLNPLKITRILITHWHGDHVLGLPGLLQTLALNNYNKTLKVYGPKGTKRFFNLILKIFVFREKIKADVHEIERDGKIIETKDFYIEAFRMKHFTPCLAYRFVEKDRRKIKLEFIKKKGIKPGPLLGKLQQGEAIIFKNKKITPRQATYIQKGKKVAFIIDTLYNENCIKAAKDVDLLISEATFLEAEHYDKAKERGHLTAKQAATIAKKAKAKKMLLIHISQRYAKNPKVIVEEARKVFKNSEIAEDFTRINL
ncbi:MAG: ribonuclease Z [Candidatus Pacearchaeota archaeon]|nr:ribonuclease Z [Candidatus Pacearchaeota archaeon]